MVGSGSTFCKAGLSEAFISTVGATCMAFATPWNKLSWTTRMFSSFPRIRTHLENKKHRARELYVYITLYVTLSHLTSLVCILQLKCSFTSLKHYFITKHNCDSVSTFIYEHTCWFPHWWPWCPAWSHTEQSGQSHQRWCLPAEYHPPSLVLSPQPSASQTPCQEAAVSSAAALWTSNTHIAAVISVQNS